MSSVGSAAGRWSARRVWQALAGCLAASLVLSVVASALAGRTAGGYLDRGPGPVPGVRLTAPRVPPGGPEPTCPGVAPSDPQVRLVDQVDIERLTVCLGPGRRADVAGPLTAYVLVGAESAAAADLLDRWAAAWSLPDVRPPVWQHPGDVVCPLVIVVTAPAAVVMAGETVRPVPPRTPCFPRDEAVAVHEEVYRAARPAG